MAYECIKELQNEMNNLTKHGSISFKAINELDEVYRKAQAFDNYIVDLAKTMEDYPRDYEKYKNFAKETYDFYMQSKEDFIKAYKSDVGARHELINSVEEYDKIINELERADDER